MGMLDGRVAIITGGGRGIGQSISRLFAAQGAKLVINDLGGHADGTGSDAGPARDLAEELTAGGAAAVSDGGDIADTATGDRLVQTAVDQFGQLDIVVNVAGILRDRVIFNPPPEDWDAVIRVHLRGHFSTIRPASASTQLTDTIPDDKRAGASIGDSAAPDPKMSPDNIAPICAYLASEQSSWLTGRTLSASGYRVGLYNNPEVIAEVDSDGPWSLDDLAVKVTSTFKPVADGVPCSAFAAAQVSSAG